MIVADTGPLIAFARIDRFELLRHVVHMLIIPDAVYDELVGSGRTRPGAGEVAAGVWIQQRAVENRDTLAELPTYLHLGERHAIALAEELGASLLIDEQRGRRIALERGVDVIGSLWVIAEAKQRGSLDRVRPVLAAMPEAGYWLEPDLLGAFLTSVGE